MGRAPPRAAFIFLIRRDGVGRFGAAGSTSRRGVFTQLYRISRFDPLSLSGSRLICRASDFSACTDWCSQCGEARHRNPRLLRHVNLLAQRLSIYWHNSCQYTKAQQPCGYKAFLIEPAKYGKLQMPAFAARSRRRRFEMCSRHGWLAMMPCDNGCGSVSITLAVMSTRCSQFCSLVHSSSARRG